MAPLAAFDHLIVYGPIWHVTIVTNGVPPARSEPAGRDTVPDSVTLSSVVEKSLPIVSEKESSPPPPQAARTVKKAATAHDLRNRETKPVLPMTASVRGDVSSIRCLRRAASLTYGTAGLFLRTEPSIAFGSRVR